MNTRRTFLSWLASVAATLPFIRNVVAETPLKRQLYVFNSMTELGQYDASDPVAVDNAGKEAARREAEDLETIRVWMSHPKGRDLLFSVIQERCHLAETFIATDEAGRSDMHQPAPIASLVLTDA